MALGWPFRFLFLSKVVGRLATCLVCVFVPFPPLRTVTFYRAFLFSVLSRSLSVYSSSLVACRACDGALAVVRSQPRLIISPCLSSPLLHWKLVVCSCCRCASVMCLSRTAASRVCVVCGVEYAPPCARVCHAVNNRFPVLLVLCCDSCGVLPVFASCVSSAGVSPCMSPCVSLCDASSLYLSVFLHENSHFAQMCVSPLCLSVCVASVVDFPIFLIPAPN